MIFVRFKDGSTQESYGVREITIADGEVRLDNRALPLSRVELLTTRASAQFADRATSPETVVSGGG